MVLSTPHAIIWVFTTPYQCIFPYAIIGMIILSLELTLDAIRRNIMGVDMWEELSTAFLDD